MKKKKTRRKNKKNQQNIVIPFLILIVLIGGILLTSKTILNDIKTSIYINKINKITFNYTNKDKTTITVSNKKMSDNEAINNSKKYNFKVTGNKNYQIKIVTLSEIKDYKYIKVYLTDQNDQPLDGFETPKTLEDLEKTGNGRILYNCKSKDKELNLRVWLDRKYTDEKTFSYRLIVK